MNRKILVMGLPGSGKTTFTRALAPMLNAVVFNNDEVRANINRDLGFSMEDRVEQARRMGWLCDRVVESGGIAIADFICPTPATRAAFGDAFTVFIDRIQASRFDDTNRVFVPPERCEVRVEPEGTPKAPTIPASQTACCSSLRSGRRCRACTTASIGLASDTTILRGIAASIWDTSVEPQRDMWKMKPVGCRRSARGCASVPIGVAWQNSRLNGLLRHRPIESSKNGSRSRCSPK
jgi:GTPase SAR1 family protein